MQQAFQHLPLRCSASYARTHAMTHKKVEIDQKLEVRIVGFAVEEMLGQDKEIMPCDAFAQNVLGGLREAPDLHANLAIMTEATRLLAHAGRPPGGIDTDTHVNPSCERDSSWLGKSKAV